MHLFRWLMKSYPKLQISPHAPFCINWEIFYLCYSMNTPSANILGPYTEIYPFPAVQSSILLSMILVLNSNLPYSFKNASMRMCACSSAHTQAPCMHMLTQICIVEHWMHVHRKCYTSICDNILFLCCYNLWYGLWSDLIIWFNVRIVLSRLSN